MARKQIYDEKKNKVSLTLTQTAIGWLEIKRVEIGANSLSDAIEKMARQKDA